MMLFSKISAVSIGELRMLYRNLTFDLLPEGERIVNNLKKKLESYDKKPTHYYQDEEIIQIHNLSEPVYKHMHRQHCRRRKKHGHVIDAFIRRRENLEEWNRGDAHRLFSAEVYFNKKLHLL